MLDEGAGNRDALEVHDALARIGAQFDTEVGPDATFLTLTTLTKFRSEGLGAALGPGHASAIRRRRVRARPAPAHQPPAATAGRAIGHRRPRVCHGVYGDHPYGHLAIGTMAALEHMTLDDVRGFPSSRVSARPRRADRRRRPVARGGDDEAGAAFGAWTVAGGGRPAARTGAAPPATRSRLLLVDRAGAAQSELRIGHVAVSRRTPDYHALVVPTSCSAGSS